MKWALALLLAACGVAGPWMAARAEPPEAVRPWSGVLPDPQQSNREESEWLAVRVLDADTGAPIAGARWVRTPERIASWRLHHDVVMQVARTNSDGIACMAAQERAWKDECHWVVMAEGYAPSHDYATRPEPLVRLERGVMVRGRVLDPFGRGVAALVEYLVGCSHGTAAARAAADEDGRFDLGPLPSSLPGQLWVAGRGIEADLLALDGPRSIGRDGIRLAMDNGLRYEGTVVDPLGRPVAGAVLRAWNEQRGPAAMTDSDGRFVLEGVEWRGGIFVHAPGALLDDVPTDVEGAHPDVPMRIVVSALGVIEQEATADVRVRARSAEGAPVAGLAYRLVGRATGRGPSGVTAEEDEPGWGTMGEAVEDVVPGAYRVEPADPFAPLSFNAVDVSARAGEEVVAEIRARPQARVGIQGEIPDGAELLLAVPGAAESGVGGPDGDVPAHVPADGDAVLRVTPKGRPAFFFPLGSPDAGVRTVTVALPPPRRIHLPAGAREVALRDGEHEAFGHREGAFFATDAVGRLTLRWDDGAGRTYEAPVDLPDALGAVIEIDPALVRPLGEVPQGDPQPLPRRGACALRLLVSEAGEPADALVLVGGEVYAAPKGTVEVEGLEAGRARVVVAPRDRADGGIVFEVVLTPHRTLTRDVEVGGR
jgi:hypothetical protein